LRTEILKVALKNTPRCCFNRKLLVNQKVAQKMKSCRKDAEHLVAKPIFDINTALSFSVEFVIFSV